MLVNIKLNISVGLRELHFKDVYFIGTVIF